MSKWFKRIEKRHQVKIFKYLDSLAHVTDRRLKIETMMATTKYLYEFCEESVEAWENQAIDELDKIHAQEMQAELF